MKALPTKWKGYRFRSRTEARWAVFFDALGIRFDYESEGFDLGGGVYYLPDFWLPEEGIWYEVKGQPPNQREREIERKFLPLVEGRFWFLVGTPDLPIPLWRGCSNCANDGQVVFHGRTEAQVRSAVEAARGERFGIKDKKPRRAKTLRAQERDRESALEEMAAIAESPKGKSDKTRTLALFNQIIADGREGAPVIKEVIQYGDDPNDARFVFELVDGSEVNLGPYDNLRSARRLDSRIAPMTGFVMRSIKEDDRWMSALTALLRVTEKREETEDKILEWVKRYVDDRLGSSREEAAREGFPFEEDGWVHVKAAPLARYVRGTMRERVVQADLAPLLRRAGFDQQTIHYETEDGRRATCSYWKITSERLSHV